MMTALGLAVVWTHETGTVKGELSAMSSLSALTESSSYCANSTWYEVIMFEECTLKHECGLTSSPISLII